MIDRVHKKANELLYKRYPSKDMSNLNKHPEGSIKRWEVEIILEAYRGIKKK